MRITKALALAWAAAIVCTASGNDSQQQSLRELAQKAGMLIGTAVRPAQLSETAYASTLAREFNMAEPEDALKWEVIHPQPESFEENEREKLLPPHIYVAGVSENQLGRFMGTWLDATQPTR